MLVVVDEFFYTSDFAQSASYWEVSGSGSSASIAVIFDDAGTLDPGNPGFYNQDPVIQVRTVDVANASPKSFLVISGSGYHVRQVADDGTGVSRAYLSRTKVR